MGGQVRLEQVPDLTQVSGGRSKCKGASAAMDPWSFRLKLDRELGTHTGSSVRMFVMETLPPGSGALKMGFQGTILKL